MSGVLSLQEVMDEELARKLQIDEDREYVISIEDDPEEILEENIGNNKPTNVSTEDLDFALALQLQREFDSEGYAAHLQEKFRRSRDQSKVSTVYDINYREKYQGHAYYQAYEEQFYEEEEEEDLQRGEYEEDEEEDEEETKQLPQKKLHHQVCKTSGRSNQKNFKESPNKETQIADAVKKSLDQQVGKQQSHSNQIRMHRLDRSTSEQVLDRKTRLILLKMINKDLLSEVHGIISTGKEANVYHALPGTSLEENIDKVAPEYAIKIYKTVLNEFKNRADYIEGDFRFKYQSPAKMPTDKLIHLWAEKEIRNLKRLLKCNIPVPQPVALKDNVLVMEFLGKDGWPAPRLKDAELSEDKIRICYRELVKLMRDIYQKAHLIHGDLSEYNILYYKSKLWIIDVSQAVEYDHPMALDFLRKDCSAVTSFFEKKGLNNAMTIRELFDFITDVNILPEQEDKYLEKMQQIIQDRMGKEKSNEEKIQEGVFKHAWIPRSLNQLLDPLEDTKDVFHEAVTGIRPSILEEEKKKK